MPSKYTRRRENLLLHGVAMNKGGYLEDMNFIKLNEEEKEFITDLADALWSWDQASSCPCSDCTTNFVRRSRRLFSRHLRRKNDE